ncbi:MAG: substrate-binding domain-containing protein, partial [Lachnospiraceae bacterium]|nr:substrate-binding domain-containing protein [Lachnospiraceae bacterium]
MLENKMRCPGCMEEIMVGEKCGHCGFSMEEYEKEWDSRTLAVGTILKGRYQIGIPLGGGGFGITYIAWDLEKHRKMAIKEYFPKDIAKRGTGLANRMEVHVKEENQDIYLKGLEDFSKEGKNLTQFSRLEGIVPAEDFFYANKTAYLVMEYLSGINLKEYMETKKRFFSEKELLVRMKPLIQSLIQIHRAGMIHRDISPDNIVVGEDGHFTLIDFGAARIMEEERVRSTTLLMKYGYAPEEQYRSRGKLGPWSDIYALSATMYYLMTGVRPAQSIDRLAEDDMLPLCKMGIAVSGRTSRTVEKGMEVYGENRYQSIEQFYSDLYEGTTFYEENASQKEISSPQKISSQGEIPFQDEPSLHKKNGTFTSRRLEKWIVFLSILVVAIVGTFGFLILSGQMDFNAIIGENDTDQKVVSLEKEELVTLNDGKAFVLLRENTADYSKTEALFAKIEAEKRGFLKVTTRYYGEDEVSQHRYVKEAIEGGYDVILCDPGYRTFSTALFEEAIEKGILVFVVNHETEDYENITTAIGADTEDGMRMAAKELSEILGGKGTYAALLGNETVDSVSKARTAMDEVLGESEMELVATQTIKRSNQSAQEAMEALMEEYPDLDGVLCNSNSLGTGAAKAVEKAGLSGKIHIVSIGGSDGIKYYTKKGVIDAVVVRPLNNMFALALNQTAKLKNGQIS